MHALSFATQKTDALLTMPVEDGKITAERGDRETLQWKFHHDGDATCIPPTHLINLSPLLQRQGLARQRAQLIGELFSLTYLEKESLLCFVPQMGWKKRLIAWLRRHDLMGLQLFEFCDLKGWTLTLLSEYGDNPPFQMPKPGLSLIGTCKTSDCSLEGQEAWSWQMWGLTPLSEATTETPCPGSCKQPLSVVHSFALHACHFQFSGRSPETEIPPELKKGTVPASEVMTGKGEPAEWSYLQVVVTPLEG